MNSRCLCFQDTTLASSEFSLDLYVDKDDLPLTAEETDYLLLPLMSHRRLFRDVDHLTASNTHGENFPWKESPSSQPPRLLSLRFFLIKLTTTFILISTTFILCNTANIDYDTTDKDQGGLCFCKRSVTLRNQIGTQIRFGHFLSGENICEVLCRPSISPFVKDILVTCIFSKKIWRIPDWSWSGNLNYEKDAGAYREYVCGSDEAKNLMISCTAPAPMHGLTANPTGSDGPEFTKYEDGTDNDH